VCDEEIEKRTAVPQKERGVQTEENNAGKKGKMLTGGVIWERRGRFEGLRSVFLRGEVEKDCALLNS